MPKAKKPEDKRCARCDCQLPPKPVNAKYCPACKPIAYRDRYKRRYQRYLKQVRTGERVKTKQYGIIAKERYVALVKEYIIKKYNIVGDYSEWLSESEENMMLNALASAEFADKCGLDLR